MLKVALSDCMVKVALLDCMVKVALLDCMVKVALLDCMVKVALSDCTVKVHPQGCPATLCQHMICFPLTVLNPAGGDLGGWWHLWQGCYRMQSPHQSSFLTGCWRRCPLCRTLEGGGRHLSALLPNSHYITVITLELTAITH